MRAFQYILFLLLLPALLIGCSTQTQNSTNSIDEYFTGLNINVQVDGTPTIRTEEIPLNDSNGTQFLKTQWQAKSKNGRPCFQYKVTNTDYIGKIRQASLKFVEIRFDREGYRWREFKSKPILGASAEGYLQFNPNQIYCPQQFYLTERLTFSRLPAGDYYVGVRVNGENSWDLQEILLTVDP